MNKKITVATALALLTGSMAFSNTPLIENPDFSAGYKDSWILGANIFPGGVWAAFLTADNTDQINPFLWSNQVVPGGSGVTINSWDDGASDRIEQYLFNEHTAASPNGDPAFLRVLFKPGDVIRFTGSARATRVGADTSDMLIRAFIKTLGYNPDAFGIIPQYTVFHNIGSALEPFDLTITYPDDVTAEPFQVIQLGFEITNEFDGNSFTMDSGTIYFENLSGYIEGDASVTWAGYDVDENGFADTGAWMGIVNVTSDPWIYVYDLGKYIYIPAEAVSESGAWIYALDQ
ncbi:hypothetical protein G0Q06_12305 [Puniceicoccales bacterium CK1056]|uniref:Uncharacterized protein n=1 Tax=Oceanipulchritudo coccoides TaxID=2706888 RepID=A0A6B2M4S9_9BACT|nr:hypothetical protein [Oceanipulchritudo coccoides]NDV63239.1 hypothetical protein [Oceanipulchritudo coccoides]